MLFPRTDAKEKRAAAYVQSERARAVQVLIAMYPNEGVPTLIQGALEADHDELERVRSLRPYIVGDLGHVRVVQRRVDLVEDEERARLVTAGTNTGSARRCAGIAFPQRTCGWRIVGPVSQLSFRHRTAAPCLGSASWGAWCGI